jgi:hypothetical protein
LAENHSQESAYPIGRYPSVNQDAFLLSRANAIQAYANLEFSMSMIFSQWLGTTPDLGGLVFFGITNTHSRNRILNKLKRKRFDKQYNLFWNSLKDLIRQLDQRRNEIVHWHVINNIDLSLPHKDASRLTLSPPAGWAIGSTASISENDLAEFISKCDFAQRLVTMFSVLGTEHAGTLTETWLGIFQQPIDYRPQDTHPLSSNYKAPEA